MRKLFAFLLALCLVTGCAAIAFAATKPVISSQPETQTVKEGGSVTFKVKAKNFTAVTWYFVSPENGEKISGRHIAEKFKGLRVQRPNNVNITLKKVPAEMHGWSLYCHLVGNGYQVDSDTVMILIEGMEVPDGAAAAAPEVTPVPEDAPADSESEIVDEGVGPIQPFTVTAEGELELYALSRSGKPTGDPQTSLHFEEEASFYVKANGYIQYLLINEIQLTPADNVTGMTVRGIVEDTVIQGRIIKAKDEDAAAAPAETAEEPAAAPADEPADAAEEPAAEPADETAEEPAAPAETAEEPAAAGDMVLVTCERCRFSGGGNSFATSGYVPEGTEITVVCGSEGDLSAGYSINGAASTNKGQASFKLTVDADTTISMKKR